MKHLLTHLTLALVIGGVGVSGVLSAHADTLALTFTGGLANDTTADTVAGWTFSTNSALTVTGLGVWDQDGDGLGEAHQVGIWTDAGTLVASGTVASGTVDPITSGFRLIPISPVLLNSSTTYRIGAYYDVNNGDGIVTSEANETNIPQINYLQRDFLIPAGGLNFPTGTNSNALAANFGPTFTVGTGTVATPEPGSIGLLCGLGIPGGLLALRIRRRCKS